MATFDGDFYDRAALRRREWDSASIYSTLNHMRVMEMEWLSSSRNMVPLAKDTCSHKVVPATRPFLEQLVAYYKQAFPQHNYPVAEGAECCLQCIVEYYKKTHD